MSIDVNIAGHLSIRPIVNG